MKRDPTDDGRRGAWQVEAARPDMAVKRAVIDDVINKHSENPYAMQRLAMQVLFPPGQEHLREKLADEILAQILLNEEEADPAYNARARGFAAYLAPTSCTRESVDRLKAAVKAHESSRASIKRYLIQKWEDDSLCVRRAALLD